MLTRADADAGFTLVELLTVITIVLVLGGVVLTSVVQALGITTTTTDRVEALSSLQRAHERMSRNIRAANPIDVATATSLTLNVYTGGDRLLTTYELVGDAVIQTTATYSPAGAATASSTTTATVIDGLDMAGVTLFSYQGAGGPWVPTDGMRQIRTVQIALQATLRDAPSLPLTTGVQIRNHALEQL